MCIHKLYIFNCNHTLFTPIPLLPCSAHLHTTTTATTSNNYNNYNNHHPPASSFTTTTPTTITPTNKTPPIPPRQTPCPNRTAHPFHTLRLSAPCPACQRAHARRAASAAALAPPRRVPEPKGHVTYAAPRRAPDPWKPCPEPRRPRSPPLLSLLSPRSPRRSGPLRFGGGGQARGRPPSAGAGAGIGDGDGGRRTPVARVSRDVAPGSLCGDGGGERVALAKPPRTPKTPKSPGDWVAAFWG